MSETYIWTEACNKYLPDRDLHLIREGFRLLLEARKLDVQGNSLRDTPQRFIKAFLEMTAGYETDPARLLATTFECASDELVILRDIPFVSLCEHHLMPFTGVAHIGYVPTNNQVVGLSKLARLVDCLSQRLQLQERLTQEIAQALDKALSPQGVGVVVEASHACMSCRGVMKPGAVMTTSAMLGVLRDKQEARAEFLALIGK